MALPEDVSRALAAELRDRRQSAGLSQPQVARRAELRTNVYQRLEYHERRCSIPQLVAIAAALHVAASELLHAAEIRAQADEPPPGRTGLRKAFGIDP